MFACDEREERPRQLNAIENASRIANHPMKGPGTLGPYEKYLAFRDIGCGRSILQRKRLRLPKPLLPHHWVAASLQASAQSGCYVCKSTWELMQYFPEELDHHQPVTLYHLVTPSPYRPGEIAKMANKAMRRSYRAFQERADEESQSDEDDCAKYATPYEQDPERDNGLLLISRNFWDEDLPGCRSFGIDEFRCIPEAGK